jgi:hypothetical protein
MDSIENLHEMHFHTIAWKYKLNGSTFHVTIDFRVHCNDCMSLVDLFVGHRRKVVLRATLLPAKTTKMRMAAHHQPKMPSPPHPPSPAKTPRPPNPPRKTPAKNDFNTFEHYFNTFQIDEKG